MFRRRVGLVAHDHKKADLLEWASHNRSVLTGHHLIGTGTTGRMISERLGLPVERLRSGPLGGDQQLGAMIAERSLDMLVFFWDPLSPQPHDPDVKALLRIAVVWNLPIACNRATADFMITSPLLGGRTSEASPPTTNAPPESSASPDAGDLWVLLGPTPQAGSVSRAMGSLIKKRRKRMRKKKHKKMLRRTRHQRQRGK